MAALPDQEMSPSPPLLDGNRLQVADVYEMATKVGLEFQKIIDEYGNNCVSNIIPIVVSTLEQFENVVEENEQLRLEHCKLAIKSDRLKEERERRAKMIQEQGETSLRLEEKCRELEELQKENNQLRVEVKHLKSATAGQSNYKALEAERSKNAALMTTVEELQSALDRAKEKLQENSHTLSENDKEIAKLNSDVETLYKQLESCQNVNKELIQSDHDNGEAIKPQQVPVIDTMERLKQSEEMVKELQLEKRTLKTQLEEAQQKLTEAKQLTTTASASATISIPVDITKARQQGGGPTFYKEDLLRVLEDRDELGLKVADLEDEIKLMKAEIQTEPRRRNTTSIFTKSPTPSRSKESKVKEILESLTVTVNMDNVQKTTL
ncbi:RILP-like protein 1 isoform X2 [Dysidea avara]|uniref:RILP-like protein 1 isoform X2 n=1 Tax=Dysidea avara TaxID=196820 RepID=UPI00331C7D08